MAKRIFKIRKRKKARLAIQTEPDYSPNMRWYWFAVCSITAFAVLISVLRFL